MILNDNIRSCHGEMIKNIGKDDLLFIVSSTELERDFFFSMEEYAPLILNKIIKQHTHTNIMNITDER